MILKLGKVVCSLKFTYFFRVYQLVWAVQFFVFLLKRFIADINDRSFASGRLQNLRGSPKNSFMVELSKFV